MLVYQLVYFGLIHYCFTQEIRKDWCGIYKDIIVFHWIIQHCFHSLADTQSVGSVFRKSLVNYEEILLWDSEVVWLLAVKRRLRPEVCLSSYPRRLLWKCMSGPYFRSKWLLCDRWSGLTHLKRREEKKDERIRMESVKTGKSNLFRIFSILWHLICATESLKMGFFFADLCNY